MVLDAASFGINRLGSSKVVRALIPLVSAYALRSWSAGYVCTEDRNIHNKTYILVGAFSGPGLALFRALAVRGAQIIALHPNPSSADVLQLILLLRSSTSNERLYAEECDVRDIASLRNFAKRWEKDGRSGMVQDLEARIDGLVFCDGEGLSMEGTGYGIEQALVPTSTKEDPLDLYHASLLLSRHALVQLLLPALLRSATTSSTPIRIISQTSPFYSTSPSLSLSDLDYASSSFPSSSPWLAEGQSSLAAILLFRELQDRLNDRNLVFVSVCAGFTRAWVYRIMRAAWDHPRFSWLGYALSWLLWPLIWCLTKSGDAASQGLLAAVLASTKAGQVPVAQETMEGEEEKAPLPKPKPEEKADEDKEKHKITLIGGALYREGRIVRVAALEDTPSTLGADLWDLESERVKVLVTRAEAVEKAAEERKKKNASKAATAGPTA